MINLKNEKKNKNISNNSLTFDYSCGKKIYVSNYITTL